MYYLGIESSCDETAAALVDRDGRAVASLIASQVDLHARYGGVVPEEAARMHIQACLPLVHEALAAAQCGWDAVDAVAVTSGPGLIGCLLAGVETAKALAWAHRKPLVAVNHLCGHLNAVFVAPPAGAHRLLLAGNELAVLPAEPPRAVDAGAEPPRVTRPEFPYAGLIVSGGHTSLARVEAPGRAFTLAQTLDDAAGECFDKVARAAGLGYPGGPLIDRLAAEGNAKAFEFPVPMLRRDRPDFSFSGLKTAASRAAGKALAEHGGQWPPALLRDWCAGVQHAICESLIQKSVEAALEQGVRDLVISGGVACNQGLRRRAREASRRHQQLRIWFPHPHLCTDNAAMIAGLGWKMEPLDGAAARALNADAGAALGNLKKR